MQIPSNLPDMEDYKRTEDVGGMYFEGSILSYTDAKGRSRLAYVRGFDDDDIVYSPLMLRGTRSVSERTFRKGYDKFTIPQNLGSTMFTYRGVIYYGGPLGFKQNRRGITTHMLYFNNTVSSGQTLLELQCLEPYLEALDNPPKYKGGLDNLLVAMEEGDLDQEILSPHIAVHNTHRGFVVSYRGVASAPLSKTRAKKLLRGLLS